MYFFYYYENEIGMDNEIKAVNIFPAYFHFVFFYSFNYLSIILKCG